MAWLSGDGNSGFYRDFGQGNLDFPRRKPALSFSIDFTVHVAHRSPGLEWKVPIALNKATDAKGWMYGPMIQDNATWEQFSWYSLPATGVEYGHGEPRNAGHQHRLHRSYRVVGVNGHQGSKTSGNQYVSVGCPGWSQFLFAGQRLVAGITMQDMENLSIGYSRSVFTWANGASTTLQPMRIGTSFSNAAFYIHELPASISDELVRGRHPLDLPAPFRPVEFYPLNDPGEINEQKPRCVLTGNTLSVYGASMQWDNDASRAAGAYGEYSPCTTLRPATWRKRNLQQIALVAAPASSAQTLEQRGLSRPVYGVRNGKRVVIKRLRPSLAA